MNTLLIRPLGDYLDLLERHGLLRGEDGAAGRDERVELVSCDSKTVAPGTLFLCKGAAFREEYLRQAVEKGAVAYVSEEAHPAAGVPGILVTDIRRAMGVLADFYYGHPSQALKVAAITGTKGKTTTAFYLKTILDGWLAERGEAESALISTVLTDDGVERYPSALTTPEPLDLQRNLFHAREAGREYLVMEASSQALKYGRVIGVEFDLGIFLNLGEDHISPREHPDVEDYFASKLKVFDQSRVGVVNLDCDRAGQVLSAARARCRQVLTFSERDAGADVYASQVRKEGGHTLFHIRTPRYEGDWSMAMPGLFNVSNALAAITAAEAWGVDPQHIRQGVAAAAAPGRMEHYAAAGGELSVIVDYAHNGMSLTALLKTARAEFPGRELTVMFGCTGDKGLDRREGMGTAAGQYADRILLTEDDPGHERVEDICAQIGAFIAPFGKSWTVEPHRPTAIRKAIFGCRRPAVVVLAGKGCEQAQKRANGPEPCAPDGLLARQALEDYDRSHG